MFIDGKSIAANRLNDLKVKVKSLKSRPKLVAVLVGNDPASEMYVALKSKKAQEVGILSEIIRPESEDETIEIIKKMNSDSRVTGILVQLPLPSEFDTEKVIQTIDPDKDVDGLTGKSKFLPATVKAVLSLAGNLHEKTVVVVGQGKLVGKPLADYLVEQGVETIRCDISTQNLKLETLKGDVLVSATGVPGLIKADMVKPGAIVIDCGAPKAEVDPAVFEVASAITPVPGGVGPMTVVSLLENTVDAYGENI